MMEVVPTPGESSDGEDGVWGLIGDVFEGEDCAFAVDELFYALVKRQVVQAQ